LCWDELISRREVGAQHCSGHSAATAEFHVHLFGTHVDHSFICGPTANVPDNLPPYAPEARAPRRQGSLILLAPWGFLVSPSTPEPKALPTCNPPALLLLPTRLTLLPRSDSSTGAFDFNSDLCISGGFAKWRWGTLYEAAFSIRRLRFLLERGRWALVGNLCKNSRDQSWWRQTNEAFTSQDFWAQLEVIVELSHEVVVVGSGFGWSTMSLIGCDVCNVTVLILIL
jgi:hypothetical protein